MTDEDLSPWVTRREIADAIWPDVTDTTSSPDENAEG